MDGKVLNKEDESLFETLKEMSRLGGSLVCESHHTACSCMNARIVGIIDALTAKLKEVEDRERADIRQISKLEYKLSSLTEAASDLLDDTPYYPDDDENTGRMVYVKHLRKLKAVKGE